MPKLRHVKGSTMRNSQISYYTEHFEERVFT